MKYQVVRHERNQDIVLMQCDFEDTEIFKRIVECEEYSILKDGKEVTSKYKSKKKLV